MIPGSYSVPSYLFFCRVIIISSMVGAALLLVITVSLALMHSRTSGVTTKAGTISGKTLRVKDTNIMAYFGIPYASSTEGSGRFVSPVPLDKFPGAHFDAMEHGQPCVQFQSDTVVGSEDCLRLSIWTPDTGGGNNPKKTVVVVATGEWYQTGSSVDYDWSQLAASADLIVVAPNHRLGVMGFLNMNISGVTGSVGLEDFQLALKWIKDNVEAFHGNPEDMVALGHGSGAGMLSLSLLIQPDGFFRRAILQGLMPTTLLPINNKNMGMNHLKQLSLALSCNESSLGCLQSVSKELLLNATRKLPPLRFVPTYDSALFGKESTSPKKFKELMASVRFDELKYLIGCNLHDGEEFLNNFVLRRPEDGQLINDKQEAVRNLMLLITGKPSEFLVSRISEATRKLTLTEFKQYFNVISIVCPTLFFAERVTRKSGTAYHYLASTASKPLFEPVLNLTDVIKFVTSG